MKYMLLLYGEESRYEDMTPEELAATMPEWEAFGRRFESIIVGGEALETSKTATTVKVRDGETTVTDGPFAEAREQMGGYYVLDCDLEQALEAAAACPAAFFGTVEIRPIMVFPDADGA